MAIASMTGFARQDSAPQVHAQTDGNAEWPAWAWEAKSVNNRGLDLRCRLPAGFERLEVEVRRRAQAAFSRGSLQIALTIDRSQRARRFRINRDWIDALVAERARLGDRVAGGPLQFEALMAIRGVVEEEDEAGPADDTAALDAALLADAEAAMRRLAEARAEEGAHLEQALRGQLTEIEQLVAKAGALAGTQPAAIRGRLGDLVASLLVDKPDMPADRLAHEVALLAAKADIREELDRLAGHVAAARGLLDAGGAIGRRLDFLCQEFNREANTLCAKSADLALTETGLGLKAVIDQMREQVQNVE
ncbi:MAG: YicC/YloC family endoribonuclease [Alphaproteobacteria bacterium]